MTTQTLRKILIGTLILILTACTASEPPLAQATAVSTSTTAPAPKPGLALRKNLTLTQDSAGLVIELRRVVIADKKHMEKTLGTKFADASLEPEAFDATDLVGEFILVLRNESGKTLAVYPDQSTILVRTPGGVRQIDLTWEAFGVAGLDSLADDIYADVIKVGGFWYPLSPGLTLDDIQTVTLRFDGPYDDTSEAINPEYVFEVDLADRPNDELTDAVTTP